MMKAFNKTFSGKWKKQMRKCSVVPTTQFLVLENVSKSPRVHICLRKWVCLSVLINCVIPAFTLILSTAENIHACQLYLWCVLETKSDYTGSGLKAGPGFLGTPAPLWSFVPILVGAVCPSCVLPWVQNFSQKSREVFLWIVQVLLWELL